MISTGPKEEQGIDGAFMLGSERDKNLGKGALNTIEISSVDEYIKKIEASGGTATTPLFLLFKKALYLFPYIWINISICHLNRKYKMLWVL